jgi:hypothetical protein
MGGYQGRFELSDKTSSIPGFEPRTVQPEASSYGGYTIPAHVNIHLEPETIVSTNYDSTVLVSSWSGWAPRWRAAPDPLSN